MDRPKEKDGLPGIVLIALHHLFDGITASFYKLE
jgi:hypothetical protein